MNLREPDLRSIILPAFPALLPGLDVLERGNGEIQIGLDPAHAVVVAGVATEVAEAVRGLDGKRAADDIVLAQSEHDEQLRDLMTDLTARGLLTDAGQSERHPRPRPETGLWPLRARHHQAAMAARRRRTAVAIHGDGRLAVAIAVLLANSGVGHIDVRATGTVSERDLGSGYTEAEIGMPRREALVQVVHRTGTDTATTRLYSDRRPELVLLTDAVVPAPELVEELVRDGVNHLPVRVRDGIGIVGPLVVPGRSSCLRCADLHRAGRDDSWPRVASQLAGHVQQPDLGAVHACAALAAAQALRLLTPGDRTPPAWNATLEIDFFDGTIRHRDWPPHTGCGCGAR
ncbi:ThiF family adenylyltransferase [Amycolatopsis keratiniphila]|uniref:Thiamin biosynthesis protein n=1 Tax=Amycolatopsis keratiniphila subsp. keratiniphila TaxID=227715 RepID=A0A1W2LNH1_9PSEU|nr:ThiF family adenylyltransferase [Amycolatopsis keratiniphila]ONF64750.1 thiamin biosynthesis protein [Amycolatopsis keratiniphila subsp. keratiniphila]